MCIREAQALAREAIDVRRLEPGRSVCGDVAVAEVVGVDQDDVRAVLGGGARSGDGQHENERGDL
jgi:hypothetical protein